MNGIVIILLTILFAAFFSGMEIAFVSSNKLRVELDRKQGAFGSGIIRIFTANPGQYIATMLIGNSIAIVVYGLFFSKLMGPVLTQIIGSDLLVLIINTIISTGIILLVAEFLPKTIIIISPNFFLKTLSLPTLFFYWIFYPSVSLPLQHQICLSGYSSANSRVKDLPKIWSSAKLILIIL